MYSFTLRRKISAWLLLSVFVPMVMMSAFHTHDFSEETPCAECVKHVPHGHLAQTQTGMADCLLCQFLSLPTIFAAAISVVFLATMAYIVQYRTATCTLALRPSDCISQRGPPQRI